MEHLENIYPDVFLLQRNGGINMIVVSVGKFVDEVLSYINMAANGEELEVLLPNKQTISVKIKNDKSE